MTKQISNHKSPRKAPQQSRSQMTVNAILDATAHILVKNGYAKTNTNIIAEYAGVSIGSLYQYFPNKDSLIESLHHRHMEYMQNRVLKAMELPIDIKDRKSLFALIEVIVEVHLLEPELHLKFEEIKNLEHWTPRNKPDFYYIQQRVMHIISTLPKLNEHHKNLYTFMLLQTVHALVHAIVFKRPKDLLVNEMINETVTIIEQYLKIITA